MFLSYFRNRFLYLILAVVVFSITALLGVYKSKDYYLEQKVQDFEQRLHVHETMLDRRLEDLEKRTGRKNFHALFAEQQERQDRLFKDHGIILLAYEQDTLKYWSSISAPTENIFSESVFQKEGLVRVNNGWYEVRKRESGYSTVVGLLLIKHEYPYRNRYLESAFHASYDLSPECKVSHQESATYRDVQDNKGSFLLSLMLPREAVGQDSWPVIPIILSILGLICALVYLEKECEAMGRSVGPLWSGLLLIGTVLLLRHLTIKIHFPAVIYGLELFSPTYYAASSVFPSLGDFLINALLLFYLGVVINRRLQFVNVTVKWNPAVKIAVTSIALLVIYMYAWFVTDLLRGLVEHSKVSLNINDFFSLNAYSYVGFLAMALLLFSFLLITDKWVVFAMHFISDGVASLGGRITRETLRRLVICFCVTSAVYVFLAHIMGMVDLTMVLWPLVVVLLMGYFKRYPDHRYSFQNIIVVVLFFSLLSTKILVKYYRINEKKNMEYLAGVLAEEPDHIGELLFRDLEDRLVKDETIRRYLRSNRRDRPEDVHEKILQNYFSGYWDKYEVSVHLFQGRSDKESVPKGGNPVSKVELDRRINLEGKPTELTARLFQVGSSLTQAGYIARLEIPGDSIPGETLGSMYVSFNAKIVPKGIGYPELLIDATNSEIRKRNKLENYSYAHYKKGSLIDHRGDFPYHLQADMMLGGQEENQLFSLGGYNHIYKKTGDDLTIVSGIQKNFLADSSLFSYQFIFLSVFGALLVALGLLPLNINLLRLNFKNRIQLYIMLILFSALTLVGAGTLYYINLQYNTANYQNIRERIHSVLVELGNKLGDSEEITTDLEAYTTFILKRFSNVFFTDINIFDLDGNLIASSRSNLFDQGIISRKMNTRAYAEMIIGKKAEFVQEENIGQLKYFAAYVPFRNHDNKLLAYLSLPYFAKKSEIERSIQTFMVTLINIYGLLIMVTLVTALFAANRITKPLQMIQDKLGKIKLGKSNEPLEWKTDDEIGDLVKEYNRMIAELSHSLELLQKSEREFAWQEMARQVAHEIKNPLTPMKLSIQHLERAWNDKAPDREVRLRNFTRSMIEQIDALSAIATEFSNFAKMPRQKNEALDLAQLLRSTVSLYDDSEEAEVHYGKNATEEAWVFADKDQLLRVFNNLIKNGIQSVPENREGRIDVTLEDDDDHWVVRIKDNGSGIPRDKLDKIFVPNFTTKTAGMGLGLAMVKNIVDGLHGSIWFETRENEGTQFFVALKKSDPPGEGGNK